MGILKKMVEKSGDTSPKDQVSKTSVSSSTPRRAIEKKCREKPRGIKQVTEKLEPTKGNNKQHKNIEVVLDDSNNEKKVRNSGTAVVAAERLKLKSQTYQERYKEWEAAENQKEEVIRGWARRLSETKKKMYQVNNQYKRLMIEFLQEAYSVYIEIENSDYAEDFYPELRWQLRENSIKIQKNTPNAGLVIRFLCGLDVTTKTISDYSRVLEGGKRNRISPNIFKDWLAAKTMTAVIADERAASSDKETYAERLKRARLVVLRVLEAREAKPIISQKATAWDAERILNGSGLWIAIGNARRRNDRESFCADINLLAMLSPNIDIEIYIINQLARSFVSNVEDYERLIMEMEESLWADKLWEKMISAGHEEGHQVNI